MGTVDSSHLAREFCLKCAGRSQTLSNPVPLAVAGAGDLTFVRDAASSSRTLHGALERGACVVAGRDAEGYAPLHGTLLFAENPRGVFAQMLREHFVEPWKPGVADTADIDAKATISPTAKVGEFSVIRAGAIVGPGTEIRDHVVVGRNVKIGAGCLVKSNAVLGEEGFGVEKDSHGLNFPVPQVGAVIVEDNVVIGALCTVASGALEPTRIGANAMLGDHVHVAHNCDVGSNSILTARATLAGGVRLGSGVWVGPGAVIRDGLHVGASAFVGIGAEVVESVASNQVVAGNPARPFPSKSPEASEG